MTKYRIPRRTGIGEDILDTGPMEESIAALQAKNVALAERLSTLESKPTAKVSVSSGGSGGGSGGTWDGGDRLTGSDILDMGVRV